MKNSLPAKQQNNFNERFFALAKAIQTADSKAASNQLRKQWNQVTRMFQIKQPISDSKKEYINLLKQLLIIGGLKKEDIEGQSLKQLVQQIPIFTEGCLNSYKMENQYLQFTNILKNLRQIQQFAWQQYQFSAKDQFRRIKSDSLELIKYFSSLKFQKITNTKNSESYQKNLLKTVLDIIRKLQIDGFSQILVRQIQKIQDQSTKEALKQYGEYYNSYCINILKKETAFFNFLEQLSKNESSQSNIDKSFKQLDKIVQTTFANLKDRFIKLLSKDKIPSRDIDNKLKIGQLEKLLKQKDEIISQSQKLARQRQNNYEKIREITKNKPLQLKQKKQKQQQSELQDLKIKNKELSSELSYLKLEYEQFKKTTHQQKNIGKSENVNQKSIEAVKASFEQKCMNGKKLLEDKISQHEFTIESMQIQINRLQAFNNDKLNQIDELHSQLNTLKKNLQRYKKEGEKTKTSTVRFQAKQATPQAKNKQLDLLIERLNDSQAINKKYLDQIATMKNTLKREQQKYELEIVRINSEYNKNLAVYRDRQACNRKAELISQKSRLIQKLYCEIKQLSALLSAARQTQARLRQQILLYSKQLQAHQKRLSSLNGLINSLPLSGQKEKGDHDKEWQAIYQQKLNKLIQLNKQRLLAKEEKILRLNSRINQLEAEIGQLKINKFAHQNSPPK